MLFIQSLSRNIILQAKKLSVWYNLKLPKHSEDHLNHICQAWIIFDRKYRTKEESEFSDTDSFCSDNDVSIDQRNICTDDYNNSLYPR